MCTRFHTTHLRESEFRWLPIQWHGREQIYGCQSPWHFWATKFSWFCHFKTQQWQLKDWVWVEICITMVAMQKSYTRSTVSSPVVTSIVKWKQKNHALILYSEDSTTFSRSRSRLGGLGCGRWTRSPLCGHGCGRWSRSPLCGLSCGCWTWK